VHHFEDIPVVVVACLRGVRALNLLPVGAGSHFGSIYPAVQNFLLAAAPLRALGQPPAPDTSVVTSQV
jgi:hypothetical protein